MPTGTEGRRAALPNPITHNPHGGDRHGPYNSHQPLPQHRHSGPRGRRQDHHHRTGPLLHRGQSQDGRGARWRRDHGLDGPGAGTRHHHHLGGHHGVLERFAQAPRQVPHQHHRHPRPRRFHHRGGAFPARAGWRGGGVQRRRRGGAAIRNGLAPGRQVPRAAHRLREQDGPRRRRLPAGGGADQEAPWPYAGADPAAHRPGRELQRPDRPHPHESHLLERRRPGRQLPRRGDSCRPAGGRPPLAQRDAGSGGRGQRGTDDQIPRRGRPERRGDQGRPAHPHPVLRSGAGGVRLVVQEQGCAAGAGRRGRTAAGAHRDPVHSRHPSGPPGEGGRTSRRRRRALLVTGLQDRHRPLRRHPDLRSRLLRRAELRRCRAQFGEGQEGARRPHGADARQPPRRDQGSARRRHRRADRHEGRHHRRHPVRSGKTHRPRTHGFPRAGDFHRGGTQDQGRPGKDGHRPWPAGAGRPVVPGEDR
ncbi:hypothetical protein FQZ97_250230 [compost metagenome]